MVSSPALFSPHSVACCNAISAGNLRCAVALAVHGAIQTNLSKIQFLIIALTAHSDAYSAAHGDKTTFRIA